MKKTNSKTATSVSKSLTEETKVSKLNLDKFTDQLSKIEVKEKRKKDTIYIYPEEMKIVDINGEKGKKHRNALRNQIKRFSNNIFVYAKSKDSEKLQTEIKAFLDFYKKNYRLNDFSINSISNSKNELKENDLKLMLEIVKEVNK